MDICRVSSCALNFDRNRRENRQYNREGVGDESGIWPLGIPNLKEICRELMRDTGGYKEIGEVAFDFSHFQTGEEF